MEINKIIAETRKTQQEKMHQKEEYPRLLRLNYAGSLKQGKQGCESKPIDYFFNHMNSQIIFGRKDRNERQFQYAPTDLRSRTIQKLFFRQFRDLSVEI
jgi:hypothetical protein